MNRDSKYTYHPVRDKRELFTEETVNSLAELGEVLKRIHKRLESEGYVIENGEIRKMPIIR